MGIAIAPAITLNRMYHCVPSNMRIQNQCHAAACTLIVKSQTGNNAVAGTDAAICANGWATRANRGLKPICTPTGMVHAAPMNSATFTLKNVAASSMTSCATSA